MFSLQSEVVHVIDDHADVLKVRFSCCLSSDSVCMSHPAVYDKITPSFRNCCSRPLYDAICVHYPELAAKLLLPGLLRRRPVSYNERELFFSRFWKLDDDGSYLIALNITADPESADKTASAQLRPSVDAIITISPRRDCDEFTMDLNECLVTCTCQVSDEGWKDEYERTAFMMDFVGQLLELQQLINTLRFAPSDRKSG